MASAFTHAIVAASIGTAFWRPGKAPIRLWALGTFFAIVPDFDIIGFSLGINYNDLLGHRGLTHSLTFAAALATIGAFWFVRRSAAELGRRAAWWYLFLATASHGLLDAMTDGGRGVAFFAPVSKTRYFLPWRPIAVSPIGVTQFFTERGLTVLHSELKWVWLPSAIFVILALAVRCWQYTSNVLTKG